MKCELCSGTSKRSRLCGPCWEMIGRVQVAQGNIMFEAIQRSLKTLAKKA